jgi:hypothetical protein
MFLTSVERALPMLPDNVAFGANPDDIEVNDSSDPEDINAHCAMTHTMKAAAMCGKMIAEEFPEVADSVPTKVETNGLIKSELTTHQLKKRLKAITEQQIEHDQQVISDDPNLLELARRMEDLKSVSARRIFTTTPSAFNTANEISDHIFGNVFLHAVGSHIKPNPPQYCRCGEVYTTAHAHCCILDRRKTITSRHDSMSVGIAEVGRNAGCITILEPSSSYQHNNFKTRIKPDVRVESPDGTSFSIDTSIIHTTAASYLRTDVEQQLATRAKTKSNKYEERERAEGRNFYPFIVTSFGTFHKTAVNVIDKLAELAVKNNRTHSKEAFAKQAMRRLLLTLHLGNSVILEYSWRQEGKKNSDKN